MKTIVFLGVAGFLSVIASAVMLDLNVMHHLTSALSVIGASVLFFSVVAGLVITIGQP